MRDNYSGGCSYKTPFYDLEECMEVCNADTINVKSCEEDKDCDKVPNSLCDCNSGAQYTSIKEDYGPYWYELLNKNHIGCLNILIDRPHWTCSEEALPKCVNNKCELITNECLQDIKICLEGSEVIRNRSLGCEFNPCSSPECESDGDCKGYCGDDECLMPTCSKNYYDLNSSIKYCGCLGLCGAVRPDE